MSLELFSIGIFYVLNPVTISSDQKLVDVTICLNVEQIAAAYRLHVMLLVLHHLAKRPT